MVTCFIYEELRKDPGIPRLPDLKLKMENAQKKAMVRNFFFSLYDSIV